MSQRLTGPYGTTGRNSPAQSHNEPPSHPPTAALVSACARAQMARHGRPRADPCVSQETGWGGPAAVQTQAGSRQQPHQLRTRQGHVSSGRTLTRRITQPKHSVSESERDGRHPVSRNGRKSNGTTRRPLCRCRPLSSHRATPLRRRRLSWSAL